MTMFRIFLLMSVFLCGGAPLSAGTPEEPVRIDVIRGADRLDVRVDIFKGKKRLLSFTPPEGRAGFMKFVQKGCGGRDFRAEYVPVEPGMDHRPFLLDLKGNGERRYLILCSWRGGNDAYGFRGYLLDARDDFALVGRAPAGEICDYPLPNPDLIFTFSEAIAYFGASGCAAVAVRLKIARGRPPELMPPEPFTFSPEPWRKKLKEAAPYPAEEMVLYMLCGELASAGKLGAAPRYLREAGVSRAAVARYLPEFLARLKESKFRNHLLRLNGPGSFQVPAR